MYRPGPHISDEFSRQSALAVCSPDKPRRTISRIRCVFATKNRKRRQIVAHFVLPAEPRRTDAVSCPYEADPLLSQYGSSRQDQNRSGSTGKLGKSPTRSEHGSAGCCCKGRGTAALEYEGGTHRAAIGARRALQKWHPVCQCIRGRLQPHK